MCFCSDIFFVFDFVLDFFFLANENKEIEEKKTGAKRKQIKYKEWKERENK
jgi:hypothetical protein